MTHFSIQMEYDVCPYSVSYIFCLLHNPDTSNPNCTERNGKQSCCSYVLHQRKYGLKSKFPTGCCTNTVAVSWAPFHRGHICPIWKLDNLQQEPLAGPQPALGKHYRFTKERSCAQLIMSYQQEHAFVFSRSPLASLCLVVCSANKVHEASFGRTASWWAPSQSLSRRTARCWVIPWALGWLCRSNYTQQGDKDSSWTSH